MRKSSKSLRFHKGILENAGFGEVAYFLKKAKQNIVYAAYALQETDFEDTKSLIPQGLLLIEDLTQKVSLLQEKLERAEMSAIMKVHNEQHEDRED